MDGREEVASNVKVFVKGDGIWHERVGKLVQFVGLLLSAISRVGIVKIGLDCNAQGNIRIAPEWKTRKQRVSKLAG